MTPMIQIFPPMISATLGIAEKQIIHTLSLLEEGATIPFISRYRKEMTGGLDEVQIEDIRNQYEKLTEIKKAQRDHTQNAGRTGGVDHRAEAADRKDLERDPTGGYIPSL